MMRRHSFTISFVKTIVAGFTAGIIAAAASFLYAYFYRSAPRGAMINVLIFVGIPVLLTLAAMLFYGLKRYLYKGTTWYSVLFILLTLFAIFITLVAPGKIALTGFKGLLFGVQVITGVIAAFLLPLIVRYLGIFIAPQDLYNSRSVYY